MQSRSTLHHECFARKARFMALSQSTRRKLPRPFVFIHRRFVQRVRFFRGTATALDSTRPALCAAVILSISKSS